MGSRCFFQIKLKDCFFHFTPYTAYSRVGGEMNSQPSRLQSVAVTPPQRPLPGKVKPIE